MQEARDAGHVLALNGGSSAGKSSIGRLLQSRLCGDWLLVGIDSLIWTLPHEMVGDPRGIEVIEGRVRRSPEFMAIHHGFRASVAALVLDGVDVILDEVLVDGGAEQRRWTTSLGRIETCWVGVHCEPDVAARREVERGDRPKGGAAAQARSVHAGVEYDLEVDTGVNELSDVTALISEEVARRWSIGVSDRPHPPPEHSSLSAFDAEARRRKAPWER